MNQENWDDKQLLSTELKIYHICTGKKIAPLQKIIAIRQTIQAKIKEARAEEREKIKRELCDFRINETEPWATIKRLRELLTTKLK